MCHTENLGTKELHTRVYKIIRYESDMFEVNSSQCTEHIGEPN